MIEGARPEKWLGPLFGELGKLCVSDDGKLQCHLCGRFYRGVSFHVPHAHGILMSEYREIVGLNRITAVISEDIKRQRQKEGVKLFYSGKTPLADPEFRAAVQSRLTPEVRAANNRNNPKRLESALNPPVYPEYAKRKLAERNRTDKAKRIVSLRNSGRQLPDDSKAAIAASLRDWYKDRPGTRKGCAVSAESRAKLSASRKALFASGYRQTREPLSAESREKIRQTLKAKYAAGMVNHQKGRPLTEEHKNKIRTSLAETRARK